MMGHWEQIARELPGMQARAEAGMTDRLRLDHPTGKTVRDEDGNTVPEVVTVWPPEGDSRPRFGKVQSHQSYPSQPEVGGGAATLAIFEVHIPVGADVTPLVDDLFVVEDSRDPALVGTQFRVRVDPSKTWRTARRFNVEEVTR